MSATDSHEKSVPPTIALVVLCAVQFMVSLDDSSMGVALPSIQRDLGLTEGGLQWVISAYVLGFGGFLLFGGRTADLVGRRRTLMTAASVFLVVSALGCFAPNGELLIAARFVAGLTAAFTAPAALSMITTNWPDGPARHRALGMFGATAALGYCVGLVGGGLLTEASWRLVFALPIPVTAFALIVGARVLPRDLAHADRARWDVGGAVTATAGLLLLVYAVTAAPQQGWASPWTIGAFVVAAALLVGFVMIERRHRAPLLPLRLFRIATVRYANIVAFALTGAYVAFQFITTLYLQNTLDWSPIQTAFGFLPIGIVIALAAPFSARLVGRLGPAPVLACGLLVLGGGYALYARIDASSTYVGGVLPTMLLVGVGAGVLFTATNITAVARVEPHDQGVAGGLITSSFQIGGAVMLAVVSAIIESAQAVHPQDPIAGYPQAIIVIAAVVAAAFLISLLGWRALRARPHPDDPAELDDPAQEELCKPLP